MRLTISRTVMEIALRDPGCIMRTKQRDVSLEKYTKCS